MLMLQLPADSLADNRALGRAGILEFYAYRSQKPEQAPARKFTVLQIIENRSPKTAALKLVLHPQAVGARSHPGIELRDSMGSFHQLSHPNAVGFSLKVDPTILGVGGNILLNPPPVEALEISCNRLNRASGLAIPS